MGIARSTYYASEPSGDGVELVAAITAICGEFEAYGWRRVRAALRQQGIIANHKRIRRLMREHGLQPKRRRRYVSTTDSDHDEQIFPDRAKDMALDRPDQLWAADLTYVAITAGFVYVAVILDGWSRRVVGYAIGRSIDARLDNGGVACSHRGAASVARLHPSLRPRIPVCGQGVSGPTRRPRPRRLDGAARQSVRQCQGRELHEDAEGRGGLPDGL